LIVVAGQEITTKWPAQTHVMGWFLEKPVKRGMSLEDSVSAIRDQNGLVISPHPFMPVYFGSIQPSMLRRLLERHHVDGIEMMFTAPIGARRKRVLDEFYARNSDRLGAPIGGSDCHFGAHDIGRVMTAFDGDFRTAVQLRTTRPQKGRAEYHVPVAMVLRQQVRSMVELPVKRLRRQL
jgi:predicted metal-dependent phosphoesterase TrpH